MKIKSLFLAIPVLGAALLGGCFVSESRSTDKSGDSARLILTTKVRDVGTLTKSAASNPSEPIKLKKLIVTLTSSVGSDAVIYDTIYPGENDFDSSAAENQIVSKDYPVKPLRDWNIRIETRDANDSTVHFKDTTVLGLQVGENRFVPLNLTARFVAFAAHFVLPDSLGSQSSNVKQKLYIDSLMMVVNGTDTVVYSTVAPNYFSAAPDTHVVMWNYVPVGRDTSTVALFVFADSLGSWDSQLPIFSDTITITNLDSVYTSDPEWTGPGSASDPACADNPSTCGGAVADLEITLGKVDLVKIVTDVNGTPLPKRKD